MFDTSIEVPVTIRDPGKPLGTHVFTAVARNDAGLRWTAVTIENGDDAKNALDRITIPKEVLDRIGPTALPRSSIVVSDEPLSEETNYRTEFVAVLSDQPQGGFITRKPSEVLVADDNGWGNGNRQDDNSFGFFFQRNPKSPTEQYAPGRRPVLSSDATRLVVRRGTPRVGPHVRFGRDADIRKSFIVDYDLILSNAEMRHLSIFKTLLASCSKRK